MKISFNGQIKRDDWECYAWTININGQLFEYYTGLGHVTKHDTRWGAKPKSLKGRKVINGGYVEGGRDHNKIVWIHVPKIKDVLYSLALDAQSGQYSFEWFCSNFGYDTDSRKALETYLKCQENGSKLLKALKSKNALERVIAWEL